MWASSNTSSAERLPKKQRRNSVCLLLILAALLGTGLLLAQNGGTPVESAPQSLPGPARHLPFYALCTLARMWVAFGFSLGFALLVGYAAAYIPRARAVILPAIDVLQSVPISGYLFAAIGVFSGIFPGSRWGFELASVLAIFTSQTWNLCLSVYQSLTSLPRDLREVAAVSGMGRWKRMRLLELPWAARSLIWNAMLSFGAGWFFVIQSESVRLKQGTVELPGLGSYMGVCLEKADAQGALFATLAMLLSILLTDRLVWRPLLAWSEQFTLESVSSHLASRSRVYEFFRAVTPPGGFMSGKTPRPREVPRLALGIAGTVGVLFAGTLGWSADAPTGGCSDNELTPILQSLRPAEFLELARLGGLTLARVAATTLVASLLWVPCGIFLGGNPRASRYAQPAAQMAAAFPANLGFPLLAGALSAHPGFADWGSLLLMGMGAQWYILFNVNASVAGIPGDLKEVTRCYALSGPRRWRTLLLPAVFPGWVTGACTAAGAAWNASVVAEVASWGTTRLQTRGLGSYIARAAECADSPRLYAGIAVMSALVLCTNKLLWRPLYNLASKRFSLGE